ncbi:hypothetical protein MS3_00001635 [Schistosoma haematobium]|uniref:Uncharacterized protein n=1 Tax=Schistosoma haematobium TaxID=6185 RepID=A0A6A5DLM8_SCHHA|nr:hypothetical protein MS3_00001635 [Schistosoma haematobium]KAH9595671.1 hypothetical protein MS3_00001635 [Schistosoma haematobium]
MKYKQVSPGEPLVNNHSFEYPHANGQTTYSGKESKNKQELTDPTITAFEYFMGSNAAMPNVKYLKHEIFFLCLEVNSSTNYRRKYREDLELFFSQPEKVAINVMFDLSFSVDRILSILNVINGLSNSTLFKVNKNQSTSKSTRQAMNHMWRNPNTSLLSKKLLSSLKEVHSNNNNH